MFGFKKKPISSEWVQKAFGETDNKQAITDLAFSQTDEDQDSSQVMGKVKVHRTFGWFIHKRQEN